ncbi:hypothetical protein ALC53_12264 [Atta colombica]|uniref:Ecdysteroid UDP-glucosyltransferase n=1 Tax=Atta colombica TaxID=520822 RepID=A0A195AYH1_9HYME|nr:hypothetical protein ALC53_12264 [Atta colombica]
MDLQDYLDSQSRNGVIYFSLGSQIDTSTIPNQVFAALYRAFEQVPQQILWTCAKERMPPLPGNVKCIGRVPRLRPRKVLDNGVDVDRKSFQVF